MYDEHEEDGYKSRSQKKRESTADQRLGQRLEALSASQLSALGLAPDLEQAFAELRRMKSHEARRRQMQYVGRLMRDEDSQRITAQLESMLQPSREETERLHRMEAMRDALIEAALSGTLDQALNRVEEKHPGMELRRIRHLAETAAAERDKGKAPKASRELFRLLRSRSEAS